MNCTTPVTAAGSAPTTPTRSAASAICSSRSSLVRTLRESYQPEVSQAPMGQATTTGWSGWPSHSSPRSTVATGLTGGRCTAECTVAWTFCDTRSRRLPSPGTALSISAVSSISVSVSSGHRCGGGPGWSTRGGCRYASAAGHRTDHHERLLALHDLLGKRRVRRLMGQVLLAGEEPHERTPLCRRPVADRPEQHREGRFDGVEHGSLRDLTRDDDADLVVDLGHRPKVCRQDHPHRAGHGVPHRSVCTSTESTAGRSRTIGVQEVPESLDA